MSSLPAYLVRLTRLQVAARTLDGVHVEAPYKPALLLAVLEGVEEGLIRDNRLAITPELVVAFKAYCHDDTIGNRLALCPNLHRAFDRHLFWIDTEYRVRVAEGFGELGGTTMACSASMVSRCAYPKCGPGGRGRRIC